MCAKMFRASVFYEREPMDEQNYDCLKLDRQLCFHMYASSRAVIKSYKPLLDEIGLTYTQYMAMIVLWEHRTVTVKEMGQRLLLDSGTLTPLLKKLEEKGLVSRRRSAADERNLIVTLTEKGLALREAAAEIPERMRLRMTMSDEDSAEVRRLARKVLDVVEGSCAAKEKT